LPLARTASHAVELAQALQLGGSGRRSVTSRNRSSLLDLEPLERATETFVEIEPGRCVQCGICSYACPAAIDVRWSARQGIAVRHRRCASCGECVARCPREALWLSCGGTPVRARSGVWVRPEKLR